MRAPILALLLCAALCAGANTLPTARQSYNSSDKTPGAPCARFTVPSSDTTPHQFSWTKHPVFKTSSTAVTPSILAWYSTRAGNHQEDITVEGRYTRRGSRYTLLASTAEDKTLLHEADLLQLTISHYQYQNYLEFETTRTSQVCIAMSFRGHNKIPDDLVAGPGGFGEALGMIKWDADYPKPSNSKYAKYIGEPMDDGWVACGKTLPAGVHTMPTAKLLKAGSNKEFYQYHLLFRETDGSAPELPENPPGYSGGAITQHEKCPKELHEMWSVDSHDPDDPDVAGKKWLSYHPQVDPVYGCSYGHEHGSYGGLAGYTERYHYSAWKNSRQDESHEGFKSYVVDLPGQDKFLVINTHANMADLNRINTDLHSMTMAVTNRQSGKLLYEMQCKSHTGGAGAEYTDQARPRGDSGEPQMLPVGNEEAQKMNRDMYEMANKRTKVIKRVNLYDPENMNSKLLYEGRGKNKDLDMKGTYEGWFMNTQAQYCAKTDDPRVVAGPQIDIKDPNNGCRNPKCTQEQVLGQKGSDGGFVPNKGIERFLVLTALSIAPELCLHDLPEPNAEGYIVFYTKNTCEEMCDGPGKDCQRQVIHSSFDGLRADGGRYVVSDVYGRTPFRQATDFREKNGFAEVEDALSLDM